MPFYTPTNRKPYMASQAQHIFPLLGFEPELLIDCGPGLGMEAWRFKEKYPQITVMGFEPILETLQLIAKDYPGVLYPSAVWSTSGEREIIVTGNLNSSMYGEGGERRLVPTVALDQAVPWTARNVFLWADVEGAELEVLAGAAQLISSGAIRGMNLEVHDGESEASVDAACSALGFEKATSYAHNSSHHDNLYLRKKP